MYIFFIFLKILYFKFRGMYIKLKRTWTDLKNDTMLKSIEILKLKYATLVEWSSLLNWKWRSRNSVSYTLKTRLYNNIFADDKCSEEPCQNNATCVSNGYTVYQCECTKGWKGKHCEVGKSRIGWTKKRPTEKKYNTKRQKRENGAQVHRHVYIVSILSIRWYFFWKKILNDSDVNECTKYPCRNNGRCINTDGDYLCLCEPGWTSKNCTNGN